MAGEGDRGSERTVPTGAHDVVAKLVGQFADGLTARRQPLVGIDHLAQPLGGGVHGGVRVAPKRAGDLGVAVGGQFPREVGHQAPGNHGAGVAAAAEQVLAAHPHAVADRLDDVAEADGDCARGRAGVLAEQPVDGAGADLSAQAVEFDQRAEPGDGALDLADGLACRGRGGRP